jgi:site-specific recombinase XerD
MTQQEILMKLQTEMELRGYSCETIKGYKCMVNYFQNHFGKPADELNESDIRDFIHYQLNERKNNGNSVNKYNSTLRFLYDTVLDKPLNKRKIPRAKETRRIPELPTKEELSSLFAQTTNLKYRAIFMTIYGSGLRVSEAAALRVKDIDSKNTRIIIHKGKGNKDRYALLPTKTLLILREYYKAYRPKEWLFENGRGYRMTSRAIQHAFELVVEKTGIHKHITVHTLRHCFATHLLNEGTSIYDIKKLLGHVRIDTTTWYLQVADSATLKLTSPLDSLNG